MPLSAYPPRISQPLSAHGGLRHMHMRDSATPPHDRGSGTGDRGERLTIRLPSLLPLAVFAKKNIINAKN